MTGKILLLQTDFWNGGGSRSCDGIVALLRSSSDMNSVARKVPVERRPRHAEGPRGRQDVASDVREDLLDVVAHRLVERPFRRLPPDRLRRRPLAPDPEGEQIGRDARARGEQ